MSQNLSLKKVLKRLFLILGILFLLGLTLGIIYQKDVKEWILDEIQIYVSEIQSGDLEIEDVELALFQHLPDITVKLNNVVYYEQKDSLRVKDQSPVLYAQKIYLAFEPWELIKNRNLIVNTISFENGKVGLVTYEDNKTNLEKALTNPHEIIKAPKLDTLIIKEKTQNTSGISKSTAAKKKSISKKKKLAVQLKELHLENITLNYNNPSERYSSQVELISLEGMIFLNAKGISCDLETSFEITKSAKFPSIANQGPASLSLNLDFIEASNQIVINTGAFNLENILVEIKGAYDHKNGNYIDMEFDASSNDIAFLSKLVQEEILTRNKALINKADIVLKGRVKGQMEDNIPEIDVNFGVKDLSMEGPAGKWSFNNVGFEGELHTGEAVNFSGAVLSLRNLRGEIPGGSISGNLYLKNFQQPYLKSNVNVSLALDGYDDIFKLSNIDSLQGKIIFTSDFDGSLNLENEHENDSIGRWSLQMKDIGFKYIPSAKTISDFNGIVSAIGNEVFLDSISVAYDDSNIGMTGSIKNLYHFIFNKEQGFEADLEVSSSQILTTHFVLNPNSTALINDRMSDLKLEVKVTGNDNDIFDSFFPMLNIELKHMSFELDKLPGVSNLSGFLKFSETETGFSLDVMEFTAKLPIGSANARGSVMIPRELETLAINAELEIDKIPAEYALDLIKEMKHLDLLNAKQMSAEKMNLVDGDLDISGVIETVPFAVEKAEITKGNISLRRSDSLLHEINNFNLKLDGLYFVHKSGSNEIIGVESLDGQLHTDTLKTLGFIKTPIDMDFTGANDQFKMNFSTSKDGDNQDSGIFFLDVTKTPPSFELNYEMTNISLSSAIKDYTDENLMEGTLNASLQFKGYGTSWEKISKNLQGSVNIRGDSLILYGIDIDNLLRKYKRSQTFNLADISAFMLAGPMGAAVTKGADFTSLITTNLKPEDRTNVSKAIANWSIANGIFQTKDVAFSTSVNRLAFQGILDFANDTIPGFTAYVLDKKGCSLMEQRIYGKMGDLKTGKLKIAKTLLGSVINFINSVVGVKCEPVYQGTVEHPIPVK